MDLVNSKDKPGTGEIEMSVTVVPKEISEVKDLTKNLKISEKLGNYDFDVCAANIQNNVTEDSNIKVVIIYEKAGICGSVDRVDNFMERSIIIKMYGHLILQLGNGLLHKRREKNNGQRKKYRSV